MATFATGVQEVFNRGFHFMNDNGVEEARVKQWYNEAYIEICEAEEWPFLVATASGAAPLALTRARRVTDVIDTVQEVPLDYMPKKSLRAIYGVIPTDSPRFWYPTTASDTITVNLAPVSTNALAVDFIQYPALLSADGDIPVVPVRWHWVITEGAVRRAYEDNDQDIPAATAEKRFQYGLQGMRKSLIPESYDSIPIISTEPFAPIW